MVVAVLLGGIGCAPNIPDTSNHARKATGPDAMIIHRDQAKSLPALLATQTRTDGPVNVQLVCEQNGIAPGEPFSVGLFIQHQPDHHTYWKFPGVIGLPTSIQWNLPKGFHAGPIRWAHPQKTKMAVYTVWGYEKNTLLICRITPPQSLRPGQAVEIRADAQWMACAKDCNPGYKSFFLRVPVLNNPTPMPRWAKRFHQTRQSWPRKTTAWSFHAETTDHGFELIGLPKAGVQNTLGDVYFFNENKMVDSNQPQPLRWLSDGRLVLKLSRWEHAGQGTVLEGILTTTGSWESSQNTRSIHIKAPIRPAPSTSNRR